MEDFRSEMIPDHLPPFGEADNEAGSIKRVFIDALQTLVISAVLFVIINALTVRIRVESVSMEDTLFPGNFVIVNRVAYKYKEPGRGEVIVFDPPVFSEEPYVKRVIGLPGEQVEIQNGIVYVDGVLIQENYVHSKYYSDGVWDVPEDMIFVMGDNRRNSSDSRSWGSVPVDNLIGEAVFVYWPLEQWGALASSVSAAESP